MNTRVLKLHLTKLSTLQISTSKINWASFKVNKMKNRIYLKTYHVCKDLELDNIYLVLGLLTQKLLNFKVNVFNFYYWSYVMQKSICKTCINKTCSQKCQKPKTGKQQNYNAFCIISY